MNALDIVIGLVLVLEGARGASLGLIRSFFSLGGVWAGVLVGSALAPLTVGLVDGMLAQLIVLLVTILGVAVLGSTAGRALGGRLSRFTRQLRLTTSIDNVTGAVFSALVSLFLIWLLAAVFGGMLPGELNRQVRGSSVIETLDERLPPAPTLLAKLSRLISPLGFPEAFVGQEPAPQEPVDAATAAEIDQAVTAAGASTVKIEGVGCGGLLNGSGYVAAPDLVITNAHVVAGIRQPLVIDSGGTHRAETVYFDPDTDLAILRAQNLAGPALPLAERPLPRGSSAVVIGYPGGGPRRAVPAGVLGRAEALGRDIYGQGLVARQVYQLQTVIKSGNSGGPVVLPDGTVIGTVFARSEVNEHVGYAITSSEAISALDKARGANQTSTGRCAAG